MAIGRRPYLSYEGKEEGLCTVLCLREEKGREDFRYADGQETFAPIGCILGNGLLFSNGDGFEDTVFTEAVNFVLILPDGEDFCQAVSDVIV